MTIRAKNIIGSQGMMMLNRIRGLTHRGCIAYSAQTGINQRVVSREKGCVTVWIRR